MDAVPPLDTVSASGCHKCHSAVQRDVRRSQHDSQQLIIFVLANILFYLVLSIYLRETTVYINPAVRPLRCLPEPWLTVLDVICSLFSFRSAPGPLLPWVRWYFVWPAEFITLCTLSISLLTALSGLISSFSLH